MTMMGGAYRPESQEARALRSINQDSYDYRDQGKLLSKLTGDVSYMAQYMRNMQKGIDDANQNFIEQLTSMINDLFVIVGGSGNTGFDFGDLKYIFQAIGALFGFDDATGIAKIFPINLFSAAWHFFSTYIIPINNFGEVINMIFDQAIATILDVLGEVPIVGQAVQILASWLSNFRSGVANATSILGGIFHDWNEALVNAIKKIVTRLQNIVKFFTGNASDDLDELENWGKRLPIKDTLGKLLDGDIPDLDAKKLTRGVLFRERLGIPDFENLAAGSDFETTDVPWDLAASHTIDTSNKKFGTKSLKLAATGAATASQLQGTFNTEEDDQFLVTMWVRRDLQWNGASGAGNRLVISGMPADAPIGGIYLGASDIGLPGIWTMKKATVTVPVGTDITSLKIQITTDSSATNGNVWLDNIVIRRIKGTDQIRDGSVTNPKISDNAIGTNHLGDGVVTGGKTSGLDGSKITSGTVLENFLDNLSASKIVRGILFRERIGIKDFENLAAGSDFEDTHPWNLSSKHVVDSSTKKFGSKSLKLTGTGSGSSTLQGLFSTSEGDEYFIAFWAKKDASWNSTSANAQFRVYGVANGTPSVIALVNLGSNDLSTNWTLQQLGFFVPASSNITELTFEIASGGTAGNAWIDNIVIRRVYSSNQISDSSITTSKIGAAAVTGAKVAGLDASKITTGTFGTSFITDGAISNIKLGTDISGDKITTGTVGSARIAALDASKITTGTFSQSQVTNLNQDLTVISETTISGNNLIPDPGFENSSLDSSRLTGVTSGTYTHDTSRCYGGSRSLKIVYSSGQPGVLFYPTFKTSKRIPARKDQIFYVSQWVYADNSNTGTNKVGLYISCYGLLGAQSAWVGSDITITKGVWTKVEAYLQVPAGMFSIVPYLCAVRTGAVSGDIFWFDDLECFEVTEPQTLVQRLFGGIGSASSTVLASTVPSLDASKITTGTIGNSLIASGLDASKLTTGTLPIARIGAAAVTNTYLGSDISGSKITAGTVAAAYVGSLDASKITSGTFGSALITDGAISNIKLGSDISGNKIVTGTIGAGYIASLDASKITSGVFSAGFIPSLDAAKIATGTLGVTVIPNLDVSKITTGQFGTGFITDGAISNVKLGTDISGNKIVTGTVNAAYISSLDASKIVTGTLGVTIIPSLDASKITTGSFAQSRITNLTADLAKTINLQTSLIDGYTVQTITADSTWTKPANLAEIYVAVFGGGAKGNNGNTGTSSATGGAGGGAGGFIAQQIDPTAVPSTVTCTIGTGTSTSGSTTSFGSLITSDDAFKSYVATPLGLLPTGSGPAAGGSGGGTNSNGSSGSATTVGTAGGAGGAKQSYPTTAGGAGDTGGNGTNFGLCYTGGAGGGGGGSIAGGSIGTATGGAGGSGGFPGGGGGGGGAATGTTGSKVGGSGGNGGNGLILVIYKTADV